MSRTTTASWYADTRGPEALPEEAALELAAPSEPKEEQTHFPRLSPNVERLRGQKICSYCKHTIEEDPYFRYAGYWQRLWQNKTFMLRYGLLEFLQWASGKFYFFPKLKARLLRWKERILLPGWVRCANPDCRQLYHASCWYQIAKAKGCLRCRTHTAQRVD